jgi:hypothetical protein
VSVDGDLTVNNTKTPDYIDGARGTGLYIDEYGNWHFETDYIHARTKLTAKELQVEDVSHIGGQQLLTSASMRCDFVVEKDDCWRCFFLRYDDRGRSVYNNWKIGDQAYVSTFNLETKDDYEAGNHFFWRLVTDTSNDTEDTTVYEIDGVEYDATDYHFIDLSKTDCAPESDAPIAGDDIVQLGNKSLDESERQNAIIIAGAGTGSPYIRQFTGITTYSLPDPDTQIKPGDNRFTGRVDISGGTLPDGTDIDKFYEALDTGDDNILRNSGFTGDYNSIHVDGTTVMEEETPVYSEQTEHWILDGDVTVNEMQESKSGYGVSVDGSISQEIVGLEAENIYTFSFKGRGDSLTLEIGDFSHVFDLTDNLEYYRIHVVMTEEAGDMVTLTGEFELCEPRLSKGNVASNDWARSTKDSDIAKAVAQASDYVLNAIKNGSTDILGGLILSQMLKVGNYRDGEMVQETGGMSGLYTSDNSPFLWGGGDLDKAFYTISKYKANPAYQATEAEVANMAKFVVTHGGRAILTDIVLRGYIYALGGVFNGKVYATDGVFNGTVNATDGVFTGTVNATGGVFSNVQSVNGKWIIDNDGNVTVDGAIKASKGLYFDKEIIDWDYYRISAGVGLAIINGNHDNIYMPENPGNGQQLIILNPTVAQKTLRLPPTMTDDRFMYYSGGELYHTTFTMSRTETVTFVYSEGVWLVTSRADFYYS